jgi:DNA-binding transcriptional regulator YiaG
VGKMKSRANALKHGLAARTVLSTLENDAEFSSFAREIAAAYPARSAIRQELVGRLAGTLWRLRRAHAIETGLLEIQSKAQSELKITAAREPTSLELLQKLHLLPLGTRHSDQWQADTDRPEALAKAFLRLCNINGAAFDQLSRYETSLWRQAVQMIFLLEGGSAIRS